MLDSHGLTGAASAPLSPSYRLEIYHPDSRELLDVPLRVLTERIERALDVRVQPRWWPALVAMADGLFMHPDAIRRAVVKVALMARLDSDQAADEVPEVIDELTAQRILERHSIEELYRADRMDELNHPRVWELNGWWESLYGVIPTRPAWEDEDELDLWDDGPEGIDIGKTSLPIGMEPERDEVRALLEAQVLTQYEPLYRLRLSWHR